MRDISGATFRFAKTLTLPFFGSGMVDLPPLGAKRVKNSRKMQMVFFVFYGRVTVDVGTPTSTFSIGRGGMWQVPRGKPLFFFFSLPRFRPYSLPRITQDAGWPGFVAALLRHVAQNAWRFSLTSAVSFCPTKRHVTPPFVLDH